MSAENKLDNSRTAPKVTPVVKDETETKDNDPGQAKKAEKTGNQSNDNEINERAAMVETGSLDKEELLRVLTEMCRGNFDVSMPEGLEGTDGKICEAINDVASKQRQLSEELQRASNLVACEGTLTYEAPVPVDTGSWTSSMESLNTIFSHLTSFTTNVGGAISAISKGNLLQLMPVERDGQPLHGDFARVAGEVNDMLADLNHFSQEITRVILEIGTEGKLSGQARVENSGGVWKDVTDSVNLMASNLAGQMRDITEITTAMANGDLSRKITVEADGEMLQLKNTVNTMVDQLNSFTSGYGEENIFKGYKKGGVDYLNKPISPELLRAKVAVFVELYRKNRQLLAQEQKMAAANKRLEEEIKERINSEQKITLLNKQLLENISRLKASNEELERFAYVASHDLQEPLRKIILFSDQLGIKYRPLLRDEGVDFIERITKASERMRNLIKNILNFSKASQNSEAFEETNLNTLMEGILSDLEVSISQKEAIITVGELPTLRLIPSQFRQLFQNLIINALKFCKEDSAPEIEIFADKTPGFNVGGVIDDHYGHDCWNIYIRDNGIGFEQKYADEIFTLFKRLNSYDKFEGTGIGLSICKKIVDKHKGHISAVSNIGEGTTFIISLPFRGSKESTTPVLAEMKF